MEKLDIVKLRSIGRQDCMRMIHDFAVELGETKLDDRQKELLGSIDRLAFIAFTSSDEFIGDIQHEDIPHIPNPDSMVPKPFRRKRQRR